MNTNERGMGMVKVTLAPCGCGNEPVWGRLTFYDAQGKFIRHSAIRCLHCHYWFYRNGDKEKTAKRWNEAARHREAALTTAQAEAAALRAERDKLAGIVQGWHYLAVGPDEMGDYYTHRQLVKLSEPYASPALKALSERKP